MRGKLERAVLALASPAHVQLSLFPDFTCKADELALDFEEALSQFAGHESEYTDDQWAAINYLDQLILSMSGQQNAAFWTEEAVLMHPTWEQIRTRAKATAKAMGWELRLPPPSGAIYISGA